MNTRRVRPARLINGWAVARPSSPAPFYTKEPDGTVSLGGNIKGGQVGAAAFELPPDCRPKDDMEFAAVPHRAQFGTIIVTPEGQVVPSTAGDSVPLGNVSFEAMT